MVQIFFSLSIISYVFPLHGLISAKLRFPIKIASTEALSCLPAAKRALPAAEFPAELQTGASPPGLLCARGCRPHCIARHGASRLTRGSRVWLQTHPRAPTGSCSGPPPTDFPSHSAFAHTSHVCAHTHCPCHTPQPMLSLPRTPCFTPRLFFLPPPQAETSLRIFPLQRSPRSPQHRPGPLMPCLGDAALLTSRGITPWQVLSAPLFISAYFCECWAQSRDNPAARQEQRSIPSNEI